MQVLTDPNNLPWLASGIAVLAVLALLGLVSFFYSLRLRSRLGGAVEELHSSLEETRLDAATLQARLDNREQAVTDLERRNAVLERNLLDASQDKARLEAGLEAAEKARREQAELLANSENRLREAFSALSAEALGRNNEMFLALAKTKLGEFNKEAAVELEERRAAVDRLVKPIGETLGKMKSALDEAEKTRLSDHGKLMAVNQSLSLETGRLTRALHHSSARGHWGELQLRRVVEMAGMLEHCDFFQQVSVSGQDGSRQRPDMVVRLAGGRSIVVDAKAPMESYLESQRAESRGEEQELLAKHSRDVRARIGELASKAYWNNFDDSPEFVVMFFPSENVFSDALKLDADLIDYAASNNVIPASPVTLIALLRAVAYGWRQQRAAENAKRIFDLGRELHERFAKEYEHMNSLGASLAKAVQSFNKCAGSAERMLFPTLRKFSSLVDKDLLQAPTEIEEQARAIPSEKPEEGAPFIDMHG